MDANSPQNKNDDGENKRQHKSSNYQQVLTRGQIIENMSPEALKVVLGSFDYVISDYDGVLLTSQEVIPGTTEAIRGLRSLGKKFIIVTNENKCSEEEYLEIFQSVGITEESDILYPLKAITTYLTKYFVGQTVFSLISEEMNDIFLRNGIKIKYLGPITDMTLEQIHTIIPSDKVRAVVFDTNYNITFSQLAMAQNYLCRDNCTLIVGAVETYTPLEKDLSTIGTAGFINILRESTGKEPVLLGKPGRLLGEDLMGRYCITDPSRVLFVGSNLLNDIEFGISCKFQTLLVCTGSYKKEDLTKLSENLKPNYVSSSLASFVDNLKQAIEPPVS